MIYPGFGDGRTVQFRQFGQGCFRILLAQGGRCFQILRKQRKDSGVLQHPDGPYALLSLSGHLVDVGGVAIGTPVLVVTDVLVDFGIHYGNRSLRSTDGGKKILYVFAFLDIDHKASLPLGIFRRKSGAFQKLQNGVR